MARETELLSRATVVRSTIVVALALLFALAFGGAFGGDGGEEAAELERVEADGATATAIAVAEAGWDAAEHVVLAAADDVDGVIVGSALATRLGVPLLLTDSEALRRSTAEEIERLGADRAVIVGGEEAVEPTVAWQLAELGYVEQVERVEGADRAATAAAAATLDGLATDEAVLTVDNRFLESTAAAALGSALGGLPALLTSTDDLPEATAEALGELGVERVHVVGGPGVVGDAVTDELEAAGLETDRVGGPSGYATALEVAEVMVERGGEAVPPVVASGEALSDVLLAAPLASAQQGALVLSPPQGTDPAIDALLRSHAHRWADGFLVGDEEALPASAAALLAQALTDVDDGGSEVAP